MSLGLGWHSPFSYGLQNPYILAEQASLANFNNQVTLGQQAAFGADSLGNLPQGPIQNIVNRVSSRLAGSAQPELAGLYRATQIDPQYFGPRPSPITLGNNGLNGPFQAIGFSNPDPVAALATSFPYQATLGIPNFGDGGLQELQRAGRGLATSVFPALYTSGFNSWA